MSDRPLQVSATRILTGAALAGAGVAAIALAYHFEDLAAVLVFLDGAVAILLGALLAMRGVYRMQDLEEGEDAGPPSDADQRPAAPIRRGRPTPA